MKFFASFLSVVTLLGATGIGAAPQLPPPNNAPAQGQPGGGENSLVDCAKCFKYVGPDIFACFLAAWQETDLPTRDDFHPETVPAAQAAAAAGQVVTPGEVSRTLLAKTETE
ncbi:MAG: hypothetical protein M1833_001794 [Piccolia ochrophora]|nr:MAG: hypothetical protein M1833_001794 [Piccolia ochrophora]